MTENPQGPNRESEHWNKQTPTWHLQILLENVQALLVLSVKAHVILKTKIRMQWKGERDIQLGEKNKGCKEEWRTAKVTKRERRRTANTQMAHQGAQERLSGMWGVRGTTGRGRARLRNSRREQDWEATKSKWWRESRNKMVKMFSLQK